MTAVKTDNHLFSDKYYRWAASKIDASTKLAASNWGWEWGNANGTFEDPLRN